jgi:hypothetical protein
LTLPKISFDELTLPKISFDALTLPKISFDALSLPPLSFNALTLPPLSVDFGEIPSINVVFPDPPSVSVHWGTPPTISGSITVTCGGSGASLGGAQMLSDEDFLDSLEPVMKMQSADIGIPSEIKIVAPEFPQLKLHHTLPTQINLAVPEFPDIKIVGPVNPLPTKIEIVQLVPLPQEIRIMAQEVPSAIKLDASSLPAAIRLEVPQEMPKIEIDASTMPTTIQVVGIPESIEIKGDIPKEITIKAPENLEVPLVYRGGPIPIEFDKAAFTGTDGEELPCFAIVPCPKK